MLQLFDVYIKNCSHEHLYNLLLYNTKYDVNFRINWRFICCIWYISGSIVYRTEYVLITLFPENSKYRWHHCSRRVLSKHRRTNESRKTLSVSIRVFFDSHLHRLHAHNQLAKAPSIQTIPQRGRRLIAVPDPGDAMLDD